MKAAGIELEQEVPETFHAKLHQVDVRGRFVFAFVREPLSWCGSTWQFRRLNNMPREDHPSTWADLPFPDYLTTCMEREPGFLNDYYSLSVGRPGGEIDFIGRYENLEDDLVMALLRAGVEFDEEALRAVAPMNVSAPTPPCSDELRHRLMATERTVYDRFYPDWPELPGRIRMGRA
jgi:hypothetical protein